ncbi:MAG: hypothetical protein QXK37_05135 [Candidatus Woesearchaeota archaeon]
MEKERRKNSYFIAASAFVAAQALDYFYTIRGIKKTGFTDLNPIICSYMEEVDKDIGLAVAKASLIASVLLGLKAVDIAAKKGQCNYRPERMLYVGAAATAVIGYSWEHAEKITDYFLSFFDIASMYLKI